MKNWTVLAIFVVSATLVSATLVAGADSIARQKKSAPTDETGGAVPCFRTCGGEIPFPFELANQVVELADHERYVLMGTVVVKNGEPFFRVDLSRHPWLATAKRKADPYYALLGRTSYWNDYEGKMIQLAVQAQAKIQEIPGTAILEQVIQLKPLADPAVQAGPHSCER